MLGGFYRTNNTVQNFNMSRSLRATYFWSMGRDKQQLREESHQSDQRDESIVTNQSDQSGAACPRYNDAHCPVGNYCDNRECPKCLCYNCDCGNKDGNVPNPHGDSCTCPSCRNYADYIDYSRASTISPERERTSTGIWIGNELGAHQRANQVSAAGIEYITGIPTGVTV